MGEATDPIVDPLWDLMLSTNGCYPGCSCDADRFDMTPAAVRRWERTVPGSWPRLARDQARALADGLVAGRVDLERFTRQTNHWFPDVDSAARWLAQWGSIIAEAMRVEPPALTAEQERERAEVARRFAAKRRRP